MRIALLGPASSIHLQRWAWALAERGHAVGVFTQHACDRGLLPDRADVFVLPRRGSLGYFTNAWHARRLLKRWRPDVVNAHYASGYGTTAALCGARPVLLSVWGSDVYEFPYEGRLKGWWLRRNLRHADAIASTSEAMAGQVRSLVPALLDVAITPFGIDTARFAPTPRTAPRPHGGVVIGTVKSLAPKYGIDVLLRAFAQLVAQLGEEAGLTLELVGDGEQRAELEALVLALGIAPHVHFVGAVPHAEVPRWLNRFDVYVAASRLESFGVAVLEASACELPVVVSDAGGLPEVVMDGETGLVVPSEDSAALAAALRRLVDDAGLRRRFGTAGRVHVERKYEWGRCVSVMERCLERLVRQGDDQ